MFEFASGFWLFALPLPWLLWLGLQRVRRKQPAPGQGESGLFHPQTVLLQRLAGSSASTRAVPIAWTLGCVLLIVALARPQWLMFHAADHIGRNYMLAIDVSDSMRAQDYVLNQHATSRLDMVKHLVNRLLEQSRGDRAGLIVFADDAYLVSPATLDLPRIQTMITNLELGIAGNRTALGDAVTLAVKRLRELPATSRLLVLLTDGANTAGTVLPTEAISLAQQYDVRIYAIGIGSHDEVLYPRGPVQAPKLTTIPLDEELLQDMTQQTGGKYYRADEVAAVERIVADIKRSVAIKIPQPQTTARLEWYWLPLLCGLMLLLWAQRQAAKEVLP